MKTIKNFFKGMGSVLDISGTYYDVEIADDQTAIKKNYEAVFNDFRRACESMGFDQMKDEYESA